MNRDRFFGLLKLKKVVFFVLPAVIGVLLLVALYAVHEHLFLAADQYVITLTDDGFVPANITIKAGDTVTFVSNRDMPFWPASNVHPTHTAFPDFDPKKPIKADDTWSFTFSKAGSYPFHDHIDPLFTGIITVGALPGSNTVKASCDDRSPLCREATIRDTAKEKGVIAALNLVKEWDELDTTFSEGCHDYTHSIGQEGYKTYRDTGIVEITPVAEYCGFGFYHGFMEAMLHETGDLKGAKEFCAQVDAQLKADSPSAVVACFHGIGHGVIDGSDPTAWGSPQKMIQGGLNICEQVGVTDYEKKICGTGVFNALALLYFEPQYNLAVDSNDPYKICSLQERDYFKEACYEDMNTVIWSITKRNLAEAGKYIEKIENENYAHLALRSLMLLSGIESSVDTPASVVDTCQSFGANLQKWCIEGYAVGVIEGGAVESKFKIAFDFCDMDNMHQDNKDTCYKSVTEFMKRTTSLETYELACRDAKARYKDVCSE